MPEIVLVLTVCLMIVQAVVIIKLLQTLKSTNRMLGEVHEIFRRLGIHYEPVGKRFITEKCCQYCKNRVTYIQITNEPGEDTFYYRCRKRNMEIRLGDTCDIFERDLT